MTEPRGRKLVERRVTRLVERFDKGATVRTARPVGRSGFLFAFVMTVLAMLGAASPALAAPGDLDTSFGEDGSVTTHVPDADGDLISGAWANDLAVQPDGKVVVAGDAGSDFALARYDEDGSLDSTFGEGGKLTTALSPSLDADAALAIQPDGKIVAAGFSYNDNDSDTDMALVRYNEAGNEDESPAETTFTVDTTGPVATIDSGPSGTVSANLARFEFSANEPGSVFLCSLDNTGNYVCDSPQVFDYLEDGEHTLRVWAEDGLGNRGATVIRTWTVAPEITDRNLSVNETLTSDTENDGATADDPVETWITSPVGGATSVTETATVTQAEPANYSFLGQQANIITPPSTAENPLRFEFRLDSSLIPAGETENTVEVFRNGAKVENCTDEASAVAAPDPCVLGRQPVDGDVSFTILTSAASRWNFGVTEREAPMIKGVTPADLAKNASARTSVTATFSEAMRASSVSASNFALVKKGTTAPVKAKVSYSAATKKATLNPNRDLRPRSTYTATIKGGPGGPTDPSGNALELDKTWSFTVKR